MLTYLELNRKFNNLDDVMESEGFIPIEGSNELYKKDDKIYKINYINLEGGFIYGIQFLIGENEKDIIHEENINLLTELKNEMRIFFDEEHELDEVNAFISQYLDTPLDLTDYPGEVLSKEFSYSIGCTNSSIVMEYEILELDEIDSLYSTVIITNLYLEEM